MAKDKCMEWRNEGMQYAYRIGKKYGLEAIEQEVRRRCVSGIKARVTHDEMDEACEQMKCMLFDTVTAMSLLVLRDEFGFGEKRLKRFKSKFSDYTECLQKGYTSWSDILFNLQDEVNISMEFKDGDTIIKPERTQ